MYADYDFYLQNYGLGALTSPLSEVEFQRAQRTASNIINRAIDTCALRDSRVVSIMAERLAMCECELISKGYNVDIDSSDDKRGIASESYPSYSVTYISQGEALTSAKTKEKSILNEWLTQPFNLMYRGR